MSYGNKIKCLFYDVVLSPNDDPVLSYSLGFFDGKLAAAAIGLSADEEIENLKAVLRQQIMIYQVDDQAWSKEESANKIMDRLLAINLLSK